MTLLVSLLVDNCLNLALPQTDSMEELNPDVLMHPLYVMSKSLSNNDDNKY